MVQSVLEGETSGVDLLAVLGGGPLDRHDNINVGLDGELRLLFLGDGNHDLEVFRFGVHDGVLTLSAVALDDVREIVPQDRLFDDVLVAVREDKIEVDGIKRVEEGEIGAFKVGVDLQIKLHNDVLITRSCGEIILDPGTLEVLEVEPFAVVGHKLHLVFVEEGHLEVGKGCHDIILGLLSEDTGRDFVVILVEGSPED